MKRFARFPGARLALIVGAVATTGLLTGCVTTRAHCGDGGHAAAEAAAFFFIAALEVAVHIAHHCACH